MSERVRFERPLQRINIPPVSEWHGPIAGVLDDCRICQGTGMATLNPDEEPGSHICTPADHPDYNPAWRVA